MYSLRYTTLLLHNDISLVERCRRGDHVHYAGQSDELSYSSFYVKDISLCLGYVVVIISNNRS